MSWHITNNENLEHLANSDIFVASERAAVRPISSANMMGLRLCEWYDRPSGSYRLTDENAISEFHARRAQQPPASGVRARHTETQTHARMGGQTR